MLTIIQIFIFIFALFALTRAMLRLKDKSITLSEFLFWAVIWIAVIIISFSPGILSEVANRVGIVSGTNFLVYISILLLFYLVFRIYVKQDSQEQKITTWIREMTLHDAKNNKKRR